MRVVLDTNQLVSALIRPVGRPAQILRAWRCEQVEVVVSPGLLAELKAVLHRPRIRDRYRLLGCALEAEADYVVTGDHHLLDIGEHQGIPIVPTPEFLRV